MDTLHAWMIAQRELVPEGSAISCHELSSGCIFLDIGYTYRVRNGNQIGAIMKGALAVGPVGALAMGLAGCSSSTVDTSQYSSFLHDYRRLSQGQSPSGGTVMKWIAPKLDLSNYSGVYVEPSQFYPRPQPTEKISQQPLNAITVYYDQALKRELGKSLPLATGPRPGGIVVRPAITGVNSNSKTQSLKPYELIPIALMVAAVSTASGIRDQEVDIAAEADFLEGNNQQVIAQMVLKGTGQPLENDTQNSPPGREGRFGRLGFRPASVVSQVEDALISATLFSLSGCYPPR